MADGGIAECGNSQNCVVACPKGIPLTTSIAAMNRATTVQMFKNFFGSDHMVDLIDAYQVRNLWRIFLFYADFFYLC